MPTQNQIPQDPLSNQAVASYFPPGVWFKITALLFAFLIGISVFTIKGYITKLDTLTSIDTNLRLTQDRLITLVETIKELNGETRQHVQAIKELNEKFSKLETRFEIVNGRFDVVNARLGILEENLRKDRSPVKSKEK